MRSAADGFHSGEVHSEFGIQYKSEVLKLGDFEDRVFSLFEERFIFKMAGFLVHNAIVIDQ